MIVSSTDRWTCPRCGHTFAAGPSWRSDQRVRLLRTIRDLHACPKVATRGW